MTFEESLHEIESQEFAVQVNVASDLTTFLKAARKQPAVQALYYELRSAHARQRLFRRLVELAREYPDLRYENRWDTALAVYLWLLTLSDPGLARLAAEVVAQARQCWWAEKLSYHVLMGEPAHTDAAFNAELVVTMPPTEPSVNAASDTTNVITLTDVALFVSNASLRKVLWSGFPGEGGSPWDVHGALAGLPLADYSIDFETPASWSEPGDLEGTSA